MTEKELKFKEDVYNRILNGYPINKLAYELNTSDDKIHIIVEEICKMKKSNSRILGRKDESYYECEEDYAITPNYEWNDLNLNEIEFYEKCNNNMV